MTYCNLSYFLTSNLIAPNLFRPHTFLVVSRDLKRTVSLIHAWTVQPPSEFPKILLSISYQKGIEEPALFCLDRVNSCLIVCSKAVRQTDLYKPRTIHFKL